MKKAIQKTPVSICGAALGMAALGNLLQSVSQGLRYACGGVSGLLLALFLLKAIFWPRQLRRELKDPGAAGVAAAFPMALTLLSVYLQPWLSRGAYFLWLSALLLHGGIIVWFTLRFVWKLDIAQVFASYFVVYVGIAVGAVTAPAYGRQVLGLWLLRFAAAALAALLVLTTLRYIRFPDVAEGAKPLFCIYTAPVNLCVAGYLQSAAAPSPELVLFLLGFAAALYLLVWAKAIGYLKLPFYPSYASFTFPFVITAIASKQAAAFLADLGRPQPWLGCLALAETAAAVCLTLYALARFLWFLFGKEN